MCLALRATGLWLRYATLQNLIPSFPWIAPPRPPPWRNPRKGRDQILPSGNPVGGGRVEAGEEALGVGRGGGRGQPGVRVQEGPGQADRQHVLEAQEEPGHGERTELLEF